MIELFTAVSQRKRSGISSCAIEPADLSPLAIFTKDSRWFLTSSKSIFECMFALAILRVALAREDGLDRGGDSTVESWGMEKAESMGISSRKAPLEIVWSWSDSWI